MHAPEQTTFAFSPAAPILAPAPAAPVPWTRTRFLENVRAACLRRAGILEFTANTFQGLPADLGFNLPAFQMSAEHRAEIRASAAAMRAEYADPTWLARELARWEMMSDSARAA